MNGREQYVALAAEGKPLVSVSVWRFWAQEMLDIFSAAGYRLRHISEHKDGDSVRTQDTVYDFIFEKIA